MFMVVSRKAVVQALHQGAMMVPLLSESGILSAQMNMVMLLPIRWIQILFMVVEFQGMTNEQGKYKIFLPKHCEVVRFVL